MGGKCQLSHRIVEMLPAHTCYCEPFAGAAWVLFRKPESRVEVINDINRELVTFYRVVQHHLEEFVRYFKWVLVSRDEFERLKRVEPDTLTDIQRAARFYYIQQSCFGGRLTGPTFGYAAVRAPKLNLLRIEEQLSAAHLRLARTYVECLPYHEVIKRYDKPETVFYCLIAKVSRIISKLASLDFSFSPDKWLRILVICLNKSRDMFTESLCTGKTCSA